MIKTEPENTVMVMDETDRQLTSLGAVTAGDDSIPDAAFISFTPHSPSESDRQGNVVVQQIEYLYTPYEYLHGSNYMICADDAGDPNLQDASTAIPYTTEIDSQYNRDPVDAIISAFY